MKISKWMFSIVLLLWGGAAYAASITIEAENMTLSGSYAGKISSPFQGIALYTNGDKGAITQTFSDEAGIYTVTVIGASNNSSTAGVSLYIDNEKVKAFTFTGTAATTSTTEIKLPSIGRSAAVALILETDNGSNDTYIDKITFTYKGSIVVKDPPVLPEQGAYYTDVYRNPLQEAGYSETDINQKLETLWSQFFYGNADNQALYYPVGNNEAYILDIGNGDVRTEGMSYGMMICLQMDRKTEFDRLWKWAKTHMQYSSGQYEGYFAWQMNTDGSVKGNGPASDGEEYFIMALMFASNRWGDGEGIYNYKKEANDLLAHCMKRGDTGGGVVNLFNSTQKQVVFVPYGNSATFTDPSYHLPAFYELWGRWATDTSTRQFWKDCASKSREMFPKFANAQTGLMPDYAEFDGEARNEGDHKYFCYDAWRCIMNVAVDYAWFKSSETGVSLVNKIHNFFSGKGIESYGSLYKLDGTTLNNNSDHSAGLIACNAGGVLASNQSVAWDFIDDFFKQAIPSGKYRYYDGLLYFMNFLHLSGNFKIYKPDNEDIEEPGNPEPEEGYFTIENFNQRTLNTTYPLFKKNGNSQGAATIMHSPTDNIEQVAEVITANWDEYILLEAALPAGKSWQDYKDLSFDVYYHSTASDSDNHYKDFYVYLDNKQIHSEPTGDKNGPGHNVWLSKTIGLQNITAGNTFNIYLGVRSNKAHYYVDNVCLKEKRTQTALQRKEKQQSPYFVSGNSLFIKGDKAENVAVYDSSGRLRMTESNLSRMDISSLSSGMYIVKIRQDKDLYVCKWVK
ncbi:MAG: T9SS type A sorting domain-containing protein [Dysgonamonadaceae bacterium]|nr:T9SS type A sorting domain-containing protein [Dysgonamonadaceae bacterium]